MTELECAQLAEYGMPHLTGSHLCKSNNFASMPLIRSKAVRQLVATPTRVTLYRRMQQTWHIWAVSLESFMNAIISRRVIHNTVDPVIFFLKCPSNFMLRRGTPEQSHQQLDRRTSKTTSRSGSNGVDQQFKFLSTLNI